MNVEHPLNSLTLVLGGARSGKSRHGETLVEGARAPFFYLATGQAFDAEMEARIAEHRARRDPRWQTVDAPLDLAEALAGLPAGAPVLVDCLTLWLTNVMLAGRDVERECARLTDTLGAPRGHWVAVSGEVGLSVVPDNALARRFRDAQGRLNQMIAAKAGSVVLTVAGLPLKVR